MRILAITYILTIISGLLIAQAPIVSNLELLKASVDSKILISGSGFGTIKEDIAVTFGAAPAKIILCTENTIEVVVPPGATYDQVTVTNLKSGLSAISNKKFLLSYGGKSFDPALISSPIETKSLGADISSFCVADFNLDGKNDFISTSSNSTTLTIYTNSSSGFETIGFIKSAHGLNLTSKFIFARDLNGDAKPDIVVVPKLNSDHILVFLNNSTTNEIKFSANALKINIPTTQSGNVFIIDMDNDGRPDILVGDPQINKNNVHVVRNTSTVSTLSFEQPYTINIRIDDPDITYGPLNIQAADLDGDGFPEIVTSYHFKKYMVVIPNRSIPGNLSFGQEKVYDLRIRNLENLNIGDFNGDNLPDLVITNYGLTPDQFNVFILLNNFPDTNKPFLDPVRIDVQNRPWEVELGDANGDGKLDMILPATYEYSPPEFRLLINTTTNETLSFEEYSVPAKNKNLFARISDVNSDGKPDFIVADLNNSLEIFLNNNCLHPEIQPSEAISICEGSAITLQNNPARNVGYQWYKENLAISGATNNQLEVSETGSFSIRTLEKNGCTQASAAVSITISSGAVLLSPQPVNSGPACPGETVNLSVQQDPNAKSYRWTGPNGFTSNLALPSVTDFSPEKAGRYVVQVLNTSGCISTFDTTIVESKVLPAVSITGSTAMCEGESIILEAGQYPGYQLNYQWLKNGVNLSGKTTPSLTVTETGNYQVKYNETTCAGTTNSIVVNSIPLPVASFSTVDKICKGKYIQFQNTSTVDNNLVPEFIWNFGDGSEQSYQINPVKVYQTAGSFQVSLAAKYKNTGCSDVASKTIQILNPPTISITANKNGTICPGDSLELSLNQNGFKTYLWSNNQTTPVLKVKSPGSYSVKVTTEEQCEATSNVFEVENYHVSPLELNTENGDTIFSNNQTTKLLSNQVLLNYLWSPENGLSDPLLASPEVLLNDSITYTLTGNDLNNCAVEGKIKLYVIKPSKILLEADPLFSPENPENPVWEVKEILSYQENELTIFNRQGLKVFEARPYLNNWNGLYNGTLLPEGVYYFILKLNNEGDYQSGNILLVR